MMKREAPGDGRGRSWAAAVLVFCVALWAFQAGFFSSRRQLTLRSSTSAAAAAAAAAPPPRHQRVVLFIVDALRFDFVWPPRVNANAPTRHPTFPSLHGMLANNASNCKLFRFRADPPTTTSQRLKALTTGTIPTFIDFTGNFDSARVEEDSWIEQLAARYPLRERVFMGDDTWLSLFPDSFTANLSFPFDSFNTRDLDTVDDGIESLLVPYLAGGQRDRAKWSLVVAHFLGVDHIGHTHSASHPLMAERLLRMDRLLSQVVALLPPDALLLFFGDHGMTDDGNHGGATSEETDSVLFAYSPSPLWDQAAPPPLLSLQEEPPCVSQVDLVPTLSLLLGLPIPFSNIGSLIPDFFPADADAGRFLALNVAQVSHYFDVLGVAKPGAAASASASGASGFEFLRLCKEQAVGQWASVRLPLMALAGFVLVFALGVVAVKERVGLGASALASSATECAALALGAVHALSVFSNSCIVDEHWICFFIVQAVTLVAAMQRQSGRQASSHRFALTASSLLLSRFFLSPSAATTSGVATSGTLALVAVIGGPALCLYLSTFSSPSSFEAPAPTLVNLLRFIAAACSVVIRWSGARLLVLNRAVVALCVTDFAFSVASAVGSGGGGGGGAKRSAALHNGLVWNLSVLLLLVTPGHEAAFFAFFVVRLLLQHSSLDGLSPTARSVVSVALGRLLFFSTAHKFDFGTLHLAAGFTVSDTFHFASAGALLALNTAGADMVAFLYTRPRRSSLHCRSESALTHRMLLVTCACLCVLLHRRHLMVWSVFAPKLVFELAFWVAHLPLLAFSSAA